MTDSYLGDNQNNSIEFDWKDSAYSFTKPVRYYKSNDPYYWEIDNIPIKQLEENILWLRDQFSSFEISGVSRSQFTELKPTATGSRQITVQPGKFMGRVNDAYNKGITTMEKLVYESLDPAQPRKNRFTVTTNLLTRLAGEVIGDPIYNNGLYDHLQHHDVSPYGSPSIAWRNVGPQTIQDIPKNKLARWRQGATSTTDIDRLNQQAVEFTRRWGGVARTSLVNVKNPLVIDVPPFNPADYSNKINFTPTVRFDLLFVYTHPVDAESTTIAKPSGSGPTVITEPRLGIVKGAGVVSLKGLGAFTNYNSKTSAAGFFTGETFTNNIGNTEALFEGSESINPESSNYQIGAPISDLAQSDSGLSNKFGNFPSPDDLMNLAPLIQEDMENSFSLIGQSVLPLAYIMVRKNATEVLSTDVIDIRPFFRTTELAYNERSGIAAAFPPLSLANPAVGKTELNTAVLKAVTSVKEYVDVAVANAGSGGGGAQPDTDTSGVAAPTVRGSVITNGTICGGTRWGVEGAILGLAARYDLFGTSAGQDIGPIVDENKAIQVLQKAGLTGLNDLPRYPGWDLGGWTQAGANQGVGTYVNDYLNDAVLYGKDRKQPAWFGNLEEGDEKNYLAAITDVSPEVYQDAQNEYTNTTYNYYYDSQKLVRFVRKRIDVQLPDTSYVDFDVTASLLNCFIAGSIFSYETNAEAAANIIIEKLGINGTTASFSISVAIPRSTVHAEPILAPNSPTSVRNYRRNHVGVILPQMYGIHDGSNTYQDRDRMTYNLAAAGSLADRTYYTKGIASSALPGPSYVVYPTVSFTVFGYKSVRPGNIIYNTDTVTATTIT